MKFNPPAGLKLNTFGWDIRQSHQPKPNVSKTLANIAILGNG